MRKGEELSDEEISYIRSFGILDSNEQIILIDCQSDFEQSGNFFTNKRVAAYWHDKDPVNSKSPWAYYADIDSLKFVDNSKDWMNASYIEVFMKGGKFFVYTGDTKENELKFYNEMVAQWKLSVKK